VEQVVEVNAKWGARQETAEACAARLGHWLTALAEIDPQLGEWFEHARSRKQARAKPIDFRDPERLLALTRRGVNRHEETGQPIPELGFAVDGGTGEWDGGAGFRAECGAFSERIGNTALLELPLRSEAPHLHARPVYRAAVAAVAAAYDPWWAVVLTHQLRKAQLPPDPTSFIEMVLQRAQQPPGPVNPAERAQLGHLTYLARRIAPGEIRSSELRVSPLGAGSLIETVAELDELTPDGLARRADEPRVRALLDHPRG